MWTIIFFTSWQCSSFVMGNDDWLSHLSEESQPKCEKSPPKSSKNEKLIFILHSTSDDWPSDPSNKSHLKCKKWPPKSSKNEMLIFGLCSTSDDQPGWSMDSNTICHPSPAKKLNAQFWITFNFWWSAGLVNGLKPHLPPLSSQENKMLIFGLHSTSDDQPGWLMDSNPICHPSPAKE